MASFQTIVALLRGINLGGKNRLAMPDLVDICTQAGCVDVKTYIQSGNVILKAEKRVVKTLPAFITAEIAARFGHRIPVVLRTTTQMEQTFRGNPFLTAGISEDWLHVAFLADTPAADDVAKLDPMRAPPDEFQVIGQEIYLHTPNGLGRSKLTNTYFDGKLRTIGTVRNWRTVRTLLEMMQAV